MEEGKILYAMVDNTCILKMVGAIVYSISPGFDRFIQKVIDNSAVNTFVVDLTDASYIDSTNLGLLAKLQEFSSSKSDVPPTLISTQDNINELLTNVGFSRIFNIVDCMDDLPLNLAELPIGESSKDKLAEIMLNAHRELVKLNETNKELFEDVVKYLEQDTRGNPSFIR